MPYINPFKFMKSLNIETLYANMTMYEDTEFLKLVFAVVEQIIIVTQANYSESNIV